MNIPHSRISAFIFMPLLLVAPAGLFSQAAQNPGSDAAVPPASRSAPAPVATSGTTATAGSEQDDEIIVMETFNITETVRQNEWISTQALTGTRTAENITNLPYQVQIVTMEFMQDFNLVSVVDQLSTVSGLALQSDVADPGTAGSTSLTGNSSRLRGFSAVILRDGFRLTQPGQALNTKQVETIKGPGASALYGSAQPGGLINYISERPTAKPYLEASGRFGNYSQWSASIKVNTPLVPGKVFFLGAAQSAYRDGTTLYAQNQTNTYIGSILFRPWKWTNLTVTWERQHAEGRRNETAPNVVVGAVPSGSSWDTSTGTVTGIYWDWLRAGLNISGPKQWYNRNYDRLHVQLEQKINRAWQFKFAFQWQQKTFDQNYYLDSDYNADLGIMRNVVPQSQFQTWDVPYAFISDLVGNFKTWGIRHAFQVSADVTKVEMDNAIWRLPESTSPYYVAVPNDIRYIDPWANATSDSPAWRTEWFSWDNIRSRDRGPNRNDGRSRLAADNYTNSLMKGLAVSERMFLFNERLILLGVLRFDQTKYDYYRPTGTEPLKTDPDFDPSQVAYGNADETTFTVGANWRVLRGNSLIAFANYCTSFNALVQIDEGLGEILPNENGRGAETGIKIIPNNKFSAVISWYWIKKYNIPSDNPYYDGTAGVPQYLGVGIERAFGADIDFSYSPHPSFTIMGGANYIDTEMVDTTMSGIVGQRKRFVPNKDVSISMRYRLPGILRGVTVGASMRYYSSWIRNWYRPQTTSDPEYLYEVIGGTTLWNAFARYNWRMGKTSHSLSLNFNNVFDKFYIGVNSSSRSYGMRVSLGYTIRYQ